VRHAGQVAVLLLGALVAAGCGSDEGPATVTVTQTAGGAEKPPSDGMTPEPEAVVKEQGFQQLGKKAYYGVVVANESPTQSAQDITVTVHGVDARGKVTGTDKTRLGAIPARGQVGVGGLLELRSDRELGPLSIKVKTGAAGPPGALLPRITKVRLIQERYGGITVHAEVDNVLDQTLSKAADVFVVFRNGQGHIVAGVAAPPSRDILPGARAPIEVSVLDDLRDVVRADVTVDNEDAGGGTGTD
jgi:hypothetical protein